APERPATPAPKIEPPPPPAIPAPATPAPGEIAPPKPHANVEIVSPWQTLRDSFAMKSCDYRPQVVRWAKRYTASPRHFTAGWERAMPFLEIVVEELDRRNLPGEFAMLPYVESGYEPVASRGGMPAGMWQLDPDTA